MSHLCLICKYTDCRSSDCSFLLKLLWSLQVRVKCVTLAGVFLLEYTQARLSTKHMYAAFLKSIQN